MIRFDEQILAVRRFAGEARAAGTAVREIRCPREPAALLEGLPIRYAPEAEPFVILQEDTHVELGNPLQGSASTVLWARGAEPVRDGVLCLIGPDLPEAHGQSLPFGQILLVGGEAIREEDLPALQRAPNLYPCLEGYMIRHVPRKLWCRVGREAARKGFSFEVLGRALMAHVRLRFPQVSSVEVLFVTSSRADVDSLGEIVREAQGRSLELRKLTPTAGGTYVCEELDCDRCPEKATCDTIRDVVVIRSQGRVSGVRIVRNGREPA